MYCFNEFEKRDIVCPHCPGTEAMETGETATAETEGVRDDGSRFSVRIYAFPLRGDDGRPRGFVEVVEDNSNPTPDDTTASMSNSKSELTEIAKHIDGYNPKMNKQQLVDLING